LRYVGIECQDDLDLLVARFYMGQDEDDETLYVDADDVLRILKEFIADQENAKIADVAPDKKKRKAAKKVRDVLMGLFELRLASLTLNAVDAAGEKKENFGFVCLASCLIPQ
jgi:hypothetical protein